MDNYRVSETPVLVSLKRKNTFP
jgi:hypothetical protein